MNRLCTHCGEAEMGGPAYRDHSYEDVLPGTTLLGLEVRVCPNCAEEWISIPRMEALHNLLANDVANKPGRLSGREIRFLRSHVGWVTQAEFARHFDAEPATVSRWESGTQRMDVRAQLLLRVLATRWEPMEAYDLEQLEQLLARPKQDEKSTAIRNLRFAGETWTLETGAQ